MTFKNYSRVQWCSTTGHPNNDVQQLDTLYNDVQKPDILYNDIHQLDIPYNDVQKKLDTRKMTFKNWTTRTKTLNN
jgi:hypothetical protein